jgi:hypothetical protein
MTNNDTDGDVLATLQEAQRSLEASQKLDERDVIILCGRNKYEV